MKKTLTLIVFFVFIYCNVFAQLNLTFTRRGTYKPTKIEYGFLSGVNFNTIRQNNVNTFLNETVTNYAGISVGGYFKVNINQLFGIRILVQYDQNGYRLGDLTFTDANGINLAPGNVTIKTNYLNFPIVGEFTFGNKIKYYVNAGPYVGLLLRSNVITRIYSMDGSLPSLTKDKSDAYKSTNFGVSFSSGTLIPISKKMQLHIAVKNNLGLSNIVKPISSDNSLFKTNAFSMLAGINVGL